MYNFHKLMELIKTAAIKGTPAFLIMLLSCVVRKYKLRQNMIHIYMKYLLDKDNYFCRYFSKSYESIPFDIVAGIETYHM